MRGVAGNWLALLVLLVAAGLRLWSLGFDLDPSDPGRALLSNHSDAQGMVEHVRRAVEQGDLNPRGFLLRGPANFLVFAAVDSLAVAALSAAHPGGRAGVMADLRQNPSLLMLLHRSVAACAGIATVLVMMRFVGREFGRVPGLCAGAFLAVAYLHVRDSHLGTVDVLWGLAVVVALDSCFRLLADPSARRHALTGLLIGMAVGFKYFSVVLVLHLCLAHFMARTETGETSRPRLRLLGLGLALVPVGFLVLFPGFFLGYIGSLIRHVGIGLDKQSPHPDLVGVLQLLWFHLRRTLAVGLGEPALIAALGGLIVAWRAGRRGRFLVYSVLGLLPTLVLTDASLVRYGMSVLVALAIPAGLGMSALLARVPRPLGVVLLALALAPSLVRSVALGRVWSNADTRVLVLEEVRRRCRPGDVLLAVCLHADHPQPVGDPPFDYVNYLLAHANGRLTLQQVQAEPPRWIVWGGKILVEVFPDGPALQELVRTRYREVLRLEHQRDEMDVSPYTVPRALEVPYARPWSVERPGPAVVLYELVE